MAQPWRPSGKHSLSGNTNKTGRIPSQHTQKINLRSRDPIEISGGISNAESLGLSVVIRSNGSNVTYHYFDNVEWEKAVANGHADSLSNVHRAVNIGRGPEIGSQEGGGNDSDFRIAQSLLRIGGMNLENINPGDKELADKLAVTTNDTTIGDNVRLIESLQNFLKTKLLPAVESIGSVTPKAIAEELLYLKDGFTCIMALMRDSMSRETRFDMNLLKQELNDHGYPVCLLSALDKSFEFNDPFGSIEFVLTFSELIEDKIVYKLPSDAREGFALWTAFSFKYKTTSMFSADYINLQGLKFLKPKRTKSFIEKTLEGKPCTSEKFYKGSNIGLSQEQKIRLEVTNHAYNQALGLLPGEKAATAENLFYNSRDGQLITTLTNENEVINALRKDYVFAIARLRSVTLNHEDKKLMMMSQSTNLPLTTKQSVEDSLISMEGAYDFHGYARRYAKSLGFAQRNTRAATVCDQEEDIENFLRDDDKRTKLFLTELKNILPAATATDDMMIGAFLGSAQNNDTILKELEVKFTGLSIVRVGDKIEASGFSDEMAPGKIAEAVNLLKTASNLPDAMSGVEALGLNDEEKVIWSKLIKGFENLVTPHYDGKTRDPYVKFTYAEKARIRNNILYGSDEPALAIADQLKILYCISKNLMKDKIFQTMSGGKIKSFDWQALGMRIEELKTNVDFSDLFTRERRGPNISRVRMSDDEKNELGLSPEEEQSSVVIQLKGVISGFDKGSLARKLAVQNFAAEIDIQRAMTHGDKGRLLFIGSLFKRRLAEMEGEKKASEEPV